MISFKNYNISNKSLFNKENTITEDIDNKSFFLEALKLISEEENNIRFLMVESYSIINEGVGSSLLKSALKRIDPKKILINILEGFMNILEKLWNQFHAILLNFFGRNNVIKSYRKKLETIKIPVNFNEERFIYTNLGVSTSYTTFKNELDKEYSELILNLSKFRDFKTYEGLIREIEKIKSDMNMSETYFDEVRGNVVGDYNPIAKELFPEALYKFFRNGGDHISSGEIMPNEIKRITDKYFDYQKDLKQIQKDKSDLKDSAKKLQKDIMNINLENFVKDTIPEESQKVFISILQNKSKRVSEMCNIYLQVFSIKLDTVKESYLQYSKILMQACKTLAREGI